MRARSLLFSSGFLMLAALAAHAASPDDPRAPVPPNRYSPITSGTKSYRPVEPLPWGDVNRRVTPPAQRQPQQLPAPSQGKEGAPAQPGAQPKH